MQTTTTTTRAPRYSQEGTRDRHLASDVDLALSALTLTAAAAIFLGMPALAALTPASLETQLIVALGGMSIAGMLAWMGVFELTLEELPADPCWSERVRHALGLVL